MKSHDVLEFAALTVPQLLVGDHPTLAALRKQYERAHVRGVELTGGRFFVDYEVPDDAPLAVAPDLGGGAAKIEASAEDVPAGCVLLVRKGRLATFEGSTFAARRLQGSRVPGVQEAVVCDHLVWPPKQRYQTGR